MVGISRGSRGGGGHSGIYETWGRGSGTGDRRKVFIKAFTEFPSNMVFFVSKSLLRIAEAGKLFMLEENSDGRPTKAVQKSTSPKIPEEGPTSQQSETPGFLGKASRQTGRPGRRLVGRIPRVSPEEPGQARKDTRGLFWWPVTWSTAIP